MKMQADIKVVPMRREPPKADVAPAAATPEEPASTAMLPDPPGQPAVLPDPPGQPAVLPEPPGQPAVRPEPPGQPAVRPEPPGQPAVPPEWPDQPEAQALHEPSAAVETSPLSDEPLLPETLTRPADPIARSTPMLVAAEGYSKPRSDARAAAESVLAVEGLRVEFPTRTGILTALDGISFDIAPGEVLGMVGESGAGKSITGAAVIGLLQPPGRISAGIIRLKGQRIDDLGPSAMRRVRGKRIGMIFQDPLTSLDPLMTVGRQLVETITTHLPLRGAQARQRAIALLEEVGIPAAASRLDAYPHHFSGGMRQRVVIALALAAEPELVIADEPTTALDVSVQAQIIAVLKRLCANHGTAVLLITHDMGVIAETADRVAVMYAGRIVEIGPVREVIKAPRHPYTVGLMGSIPSLKGEAKRLVQIPGSMPRLDSIPPGCPFNPRCPYVFARCIVERPELAPAGSSHAACWLHVPNSGAPRHLGDL